MSEFSTDVLVVGAGGAGMYAALAAAKAGAKVLLVDKNVVGRGGATIMAQMTVAVALAEQEPDTWEAHLADTLAAGRGLCDRTLAEVLCRQAPERMREMDAWGVGWARAEGHITQVMAPGHDRPRCCYVDFLNTGPAVAATLRKQINKQTNIRRLSNVSITDLLTVDGRIAGAVGLALGDGKSVVIKAPACVVATGGLTKLYGRNSASSNMAGEGFALALGAGAELLDMEFVQFFPIGHLAPRLVGMDPIMWDPFRYKLGGRLLNGHHEEFIDRYGGEDDGKYTATRDLATYAICREVEAGRGSPHGGAYLSFTHIPEPELRAAFGPVIDRLMRNGIDLKTMPVEVSPIAHYHMGGIRVAAAMASRVPGLFAAGEAVGGANGANRLSGNAISEALVYGDLAGRSAAACAESTQPPDWHQSSVDHVLAEVVRNIAPPPDNGGRSAVNLMRSLQSLMWSKVGPFRTEEGLTEALESIHSMRVTDLPAVPASAPGPFAIELTEWHELRHALLVAEAITASALARKESRGAHQRDDYPRISDAFDLNQVISMTPDGLQLAAVPNAGAQHVG